METRPYLRKRLLFFIVLHLVSFIRDGQIFCLALSLIFWEICLGPSLIRLLFFWKILIRSQFIFHFDMKCVSNKLLKGANFLYEA